MMRPALRGLVAACLLIVAIAAAGQTEQHAEAAQYGAAGEVIHLQQIIDNADAGSTVILPPGDYEGPITISKPLRLEAAESGSVTLVNESDDSAILIESEQVAVIGLQIVDEGRKDAAAIHVIRDRVWLENLELSTEGYGIRLENANDAVIKNNSVYRDAPSSSKMTERGNGIELYYSHRAQIIGNDIGSMYDGIYLESSDDSLVEGNRIEESRYGIHCMYTTGTQVVNNIGSMNITGSMIMAVNQVKVTGNTFEKQSGNVNSQGILLYDAHESEVTDNIVVGNRVGLYVEYSTNNVLAGNEVSYNFIGLQMMSSTDNEITSNQFIGNVSDASAQESEDNELHGNFWDSFSGIDADGDGYSDISYAINPFFQSLVQKRPPFQLFFRAPGIVFVEGLYSAGQMEWSTDYSPLMTPQAASEAAISQESGWRTGMTGAVLLLLAIIIVTISRRKST